MEHNRPDLDALSGAAILWLCPMLRDPRITKEQTIGALCSLVRRVKEIDEKISPSVYDPTKPDTGDRPPLGDDYNLLFDAIFDEIHAIIPPPAG